MGNSKKNIFFVYNAFIYLNSLELRNKLRLESSECVLIINTFRTKNLRQLINIINKEDWSEIHYTFFNINKVTKHQLYSDSNSRHGFFRMLFLYLKGFLKTKAIVKKYNNLNLLVNGIYKDYLVSHFANSVNYKEYYYVDDGNMTLFVNENIRKEEAKNNFKIKFFEGNFKEKLFYYILTKIYKLNIRPIKHIHFFSSHNLVEYEYDSYDKNEYQQLSSSIAHKQIDDDLVFFLGGPLIEIGICHPENYYKLMDKVVENYNNKKIIYLPHRFENEKELLDLKVRYKFEILKHDMPIELYLSTLVTIPSTIASFYSSALGNLNVFLPKSIMIEAFEIPNEMIIPNNKRKMIGEIYLRYIQLMSSEKRFRVVNYLKH